MTLQEGPIAGSRCSHVLLFSFRCYLQSFASVPLASGLKVFVGYSMSRPVGASGIPLGAMSREQLPGTGVMQLLVGEGEDGREGKIDVCEACWR